MRQERNLKARRKPNAVTPQPKAKNSAIAPSTGSPIKDEPKGIYLNADGELAITKTASRTMRTTFMGSNINTDPSLQDCTDLENARLSQLAGALPYGSGKVGSVQALNLGLDAVATLLPRDGMEVMLCSHLVALHSQGMEFLRRGMLSDQTVDGVDRNVTRATKLFKTFATMADCLRTYRGGGHQRVTVEHVTVQSGGQAIVGTVNQGPGGGDVDQNCG